MTFEEGVILRTISRLLSGEDYRDEIVNAINSQFFASPDDAAIYSD